jgi:hypothetical protein
LRYYVSDKIGFLIKFLFPAKLDDLPLPALSSMNAIQKIAKGSSLILLWMISALSLFGFLYALFNWKIHWLLWSFIPFSLVAVQSYLGFIEQRFLSVSYPFMVVMSAAVISGLYAIIRRKFSVQPR